MTGRPSAWCTGVVLASVALGAACAPEPPATSVAIDELRPTRVPQAGPAFHVGDVVEHHPSPGGTFLIHYTRTVGSDPGNTNAVPDTDANHDGTPDFVEETGRIYDEVLAFYRDQRMFRAPPSDEGYPDNGGDGRFDVYLVDFAGHADGAFRSEDCGGRLTCPGYMLQENDFAGYSYDTPSDGIRTLCSHEFFHAVQAGYDTRNEGRGAVLSESTAEWATEQYDPALTDFENMLAGYFMRPDRALDSVPTGPVDSFAYGAGIWWQFLDERHDNTLVRRVWTACGDDDGSTNWLHLLDGILQRDFHSSFAAEYAEFVVWNLYTNVRVNTMRAYDHGRDYPLVASTRVTLPYAEPLTRLFYSSSRYYRAQPAERAAVTAAFVVRPDAPTDALEGAQLRLALRRNNTIEEPRRLADPAAGTEAIEVNGADEVFAILSNVRMEGPSRTPAFCFGSVAEVRECIVAQGGLLPDAGTADAGVTDGSVPADGSTPTPIPAGGDCGCRTQPRGSGPTAGVSLLALAAGLASRRRRRPG